jgi:cytosine deaminase
VTRIKELKRRSINVAFGHDCCLDPWYPLGTYDMLEVAHMGIHEAQMNSVAEMEGAVDSITYAGAKSMCLDGYGLEPGNYADMVVLAAADRIEAVRLRADRLHVIRRGKVIARTKPADITVSLDGRESKVNFLRADHDHSKH